MVWGDERGYAGVLTANSQRLMLVGSNVTWAIDRVSGAYELKVGDMPIEGTCQPAPFTPLAKPTF
jgi:hypothetical protein